MTRKKRKSLNDSLAQEFVFGNASDDSDDETDEPVDSTESSNSEPDKPVMSDQLDIPIKKTSKLMDQLQAESKEATKRLTVDLKASTHRKLSMLAAKTGRTKADIVRLLLDDALEDIEE
ncbi:MAG: hypothetical protein ABEI32_16930 [Halothece sp.]